MEKGVWMGIVEMNGTSENENIVMERVLDRSSRLFLIEQCKILNWILRNGVITLFNINSTIDRKDCNNYYCRMRRTDSPFAHPNDVLLITFSSHQQRRIAVSGGGGGWECNSIMNEAQKQFLSIYHPRVLHYAPKKNIKMQKRQRDSTTGYGDSFGSTFVPL